MHSFVRALAGASAITGGLVLLCLILMTCISIVGRALISAGLGPVEGDFEFVEAGVAFAIFAFLPWVQFSRGHATVDLLAPLFGATLNRWLDALADVLMMLVALVITWRLALGLLDKKSYFETTFILQYPVWWAYAACLAGAVIWCLVCVYSTSASMRNAVRGTR